MEENKQNRNNRKKKIIAFVLFSIVAIVGVIATIIYIQYKKTHITTDDAFIEGSIHIISFKVSGRVRAVHVSDNQFVREGTLLAEIEPADYEVKVKEAESILDAERAKLAEALTQLDVAEKQRSEMEYGVKSAKAELEVERANLRQAERDIIRAENLFKKDAISRERYEKTNTEYDVSLALVISAEDRLKQAQASLEKQKAIIRQAEVALRAQEAMVNVREAALKEAGLKEVYTKIYAPADGYVTRKSVEIGNQVEVGQPLMAIVPLDNIWVVGNYKETQLQNVRPGQRARIKVDTYPGRIFWGEVDSIMAGTGAVFSLFPPENATGNYVKVVQRIPVKITLDKDTDAEHVLRIGMSVVPTILIEKK
ncbi:MAG: HlyD family secretion protein [Nitrospirota bacterium]